MRSFKERIYTLLPYFLQNTMVSIYNLSQNRVRHSGNYNRYKHAFQESRELSLDELRIKQKELLLNFLTFAKNKSAYYRRILSSFQSATDNTLDFYKRIPIQTKEDIRSNLTGIYTVSKSNSVVSKTGGTTGKSLEVRFTKDDVQKRFAILDSWRESFGYDLRKGVAWFSGKNLLGERDLKRHRFWKYDFLQNIKYYSTFHLSQNSIKYYIDDINIFRPMFAVGFPSSIFEIAKWGLENDYLLSYKMEVIFPTAETIVPEEKKVIEAFFGAKVINQYASSEGAPFILECPQGNLHLELLSGYFEVLDSYSEDTTNGTLVFTSFTTHGTPLIRYAIGDVVKLSDYSCTCGNNNPLVQSIEGRINDFIYSKERGKINLGNISNCIKYVKGIKKFQVKQYTEDEIRVAVVAATEYGERDEAMFREELERRLGNRVKILFEYVDDIPKEASGKYRLVHNYLQLS